MGPKFPPWYRTEREYCIKKINKKRAKIQKHTEKIKELKHEIEILEEMSHKCQA